MRRRIDVIWPRPHWKSGRLEMAAALNYRESFDFNIMQRLDKRFVRRDAFMKQIRPQRD
jgi:hypothetical protein